MTLATQEVRTFFVTSVTIDRHAIFKSDRMADLMVRVLKDYREQGKFLLHEFVIMPDHFHLLLTPSLETPLEKAIQYVKGGFSFRAKKELQFHASIWERSFTTHRVRDDNDYGRHCEYIRRNPVKRFLVESEDLFPYSSAHPGAVVDPAPPWLSSLRGKAARSSRG